MRIGAISSSNLYLRTDNNDLKSDAKFYSNSVQPNDQVAFTMRFICYKDEAKTIRKMLRWGKNLYVKVNGNKFKPFTEAEDLVQQNPNITGIVFMESENFRQTPMAKIADIIYENDKLERIICISKNKNNQDKPLLFRTFRLPLYLNNRQHLATQIDEFTTAFPRENLSELLSKIYKAQPDDFVFETAEGRTLSLADTIYSALCKIFRVQAKNEIVGKRFVYEEPPQRLVS